MAVLQYDPEGVEDRRPHVVLAFLTAFVTSRQSFTQLLHFLQKAKGSTGVSHQTRLVGCLTRTMLVHKVPFNSVRYPH